jgi:hypothetical protein
MTKVHHPAVKWSGLALFFCLFLLAMDNLMDPLGLTAILAVGLTVWISGKTLVGYAGSSKIRLKRTVVGIIILGIALRFAWALSVPTTPVSDFQGYNIVAFLLSQGRLPADLPRNIGYPLLLSIGYRIFPAALTGRIINAAASSVTTVLVFLLGSDLAGPMAGVLAAFLFALLPMEISMVSVLATEVSATMFLTGALYLLVAGIRKPKNAMKIYFSGVLLGFAQFTRGQTLFYAPIFLLLPLFSPFASLRGKIKRMLLFGMGALTTVSFFVAWHSLEVRHPSTAILGTQDSEPFLMGTNIETGGAWNAADDDLFYSWPDDRRDQYARKEAVRRVFGNVGGYLLFIPRKFSQLMDNEYAGSWSVNFVDPRLWAKWPRLQGAIESVDVLLSRAVYAVLVMLTLFFFADIGDEITAVIALAAVLMTMGPFVILEVQGRYHHQMLPILAISASCGLMNVLKRKSGSGRQAVTVARQPAASPVPSATP